MIEPPPAPTSETIPINAAPAVPGTPVVLGVRSASFDGPDVIIAGPQSYGIVNLTEAAVVYAVFDGSANPDALSLDDDTVLYRSDPIGVPGSAGADVDHDAGSYWRAIFDEGGTLLFAAPFTVVE